MSSDLAPRLVPLQAAVQNYAWGLLPEAGSLVASLHAKNANTQVDAKLPYAELWMGTHKSGPARLLSDTDTTLSEFIQRNSFQPMPYLFKILSVSKPLSIQAHPDKERAARLHEENPTAYKDDNHKPEMCVALTEFEGLCNFCPVEEVMANIKSQPVLASLCGGGRVVHALATAKAESEKREALRALFSNLMNASEVEINGTLASVRKGLNAKVEMMEEDKLFLRLLEHYPGDVGCFAAYLLNYVRIRPGQAFFMSANEPHAYLKGQCVEIMANSDNVVRAGLTPKFKDVSTLLEILTYQDGPPEILTGECLDDNSILYQPPAEEFQLTKYIVPPGKTQQLHSANGPGVLLCLEGSGRVNLADSGQDNDNTGKALPLSPGCIYYVKDSEALIVESDNSADEDAAPSDLILFRAGVNQSS